MCKKISSLDLITALMEVEVTFYLNTKQSIKIYCYFFNLYPFNACICFWKNKEYIYLKECLYNFIIFFIVMKLEIFFIKSSFFYLVIYLMAAYKLDIIVTTYAVIFMIDKKIHFFQIISSVNYFSYL